MSTGIRYKLVPNENLFVETDFVDGRIRLLQKQNHLHYRECEFTHLGWLQLVPYRELERVVARNCYPRNLRVLGPV